MLIQRAAGTVYAQDAFGDPPWYRLGNDARREETLAGFACQFSSFDWRCGWASSESDLAETGFEFRLHALGLCDDAVERGGLFLELSGVVVHGRHVTAMIRVLHIQ